MATTAKGTPYVVSTDLVANYPTVSSDLATHIDSKLAYNAVTINAQTGTTYTFALSDASEGKLVTASNASPSTYTVPPQSSVTWANGAVLSILNQGAGTVTIAGGSGVTINGTPLTLSQYQAATIVRTASDTWTLIRSGSAGKILQVVSTTKTDTFTTTSTSFTDITGLSVSITPTSATSTIYVAVSLTGSQDVGATDMFAQTVRGSTAIYLGDAAGNRTRASMMFVSGAAGWVQTSSYSFVDSPATTSATTYKVQVKVTGSTGYINRTENDTDASFSPRTPSSITVMEVAA